MFFPSGELSAIPAFSNSLNPNGFKPCLLSSFVQFARAEYTRTPNGSFNQPYNFSVAVDYDDCVAVMAQTETNREAA